MTLTKERLEQFISKPLEHGLTRGEQMEMARIALASLEAEAAGIVRHIELRGPEQPAGIHVSLYSKLDDGVVLYTAPPAPVVPDERYQHLSELYHSQEKRLFKLAQRIKGPSFDKYAYSTSQAIDVLETTIFGEKEDNGSACRAAMLQGAEPTKTGLTLREGLAAIRNSGIAIDAENIQAERDALNEPVQEWIPCSERMPETGQKVLAYRPDAPESDDPLIRMATYVGKSAHGHGFDCYCKPSHWMPLPAAPQQEAK